jgi:probable rRNA maturation factor
MPARTHIQIQIATSRARIPHANSLRAWARAAIPSAGYAICIRVVGSAESRKLNRQWRGKDKPTNVLSFPYSEFPASDQRPGASWPIVVGDLVLCAPVVTREAREQGKPAQAHWAHMVVHGLLHLQGHDHVKNRDAKRMEASEVEILSGLGYPNPYLDSTWL